LDGFRVLFGPLGMALHGGISCQVSLCGRRRTHVGIVRRAPRIPAEAALRPGTRTGCSSVVRSLGPPFPSVFVTLRASCPLQYFRPISGGAHSGESRIREKFSPRLRRRSLAGGAVSRRKGVRPCLWQEKAQANPCFDPFAREGSSASRSTFTRR